MGNSIYPKVSVYPTVSFPEFFFSFLSYITIVQSSKLGNWHWWNIIDLSQISRVSPDIENRLTDVGLGGGWEEGEGEMFGESKMDIYNTICKIDSQWEFAIWLREFKQTFCDNLERYWVGVDGREFGEGGNMGVLTADSCWCMTENHKIV